MDLPQLNAMTRYWKDFPPAHLLLRRIAGAVGVKFDAMQTSAQPRVARDDRPVDAGAVAHGMGVPILRGPKLKLMTADEYLAMRA